MRIDSKHDQSGSINSSSSFVEFDISSFLNMKLGKLELFSEEFDIKEARLISPVLGCLLLDVSVAISSKPATITLEIPQLKSKDDDLFLTIKSSPRPSSVGRVSSRSKSSCGSFTMLNQDDSQDDIKVVDEDSLEHLSKEELIDQVKQLRKQNAELKNAHRPQVAPTIPPNRCELLENMIVVLKNDLATVLNAIQRDGNYQIFDEIKEKVSFFS